MRSPSRIASAGACVTIRQVARVSRRSCSVSSCMRLAQLHVEAGERLVHQHHRRARQDRARKRHPLLLAAREDVRIVVGVALEADAGQRRQRLAGGILARQRLETEGDVVADGEVRKQREVLEHQPDVALLRRHEPPGPRHLEIVDEHAAAGRLLDAGGDAQQRGLAAARRPQQAHDLARRDVEREPGERMGSGKVPLDPLERQARGDRRRSPPPPTPPAAVSGRLRQNGRRNSRASSQARTAAYWAVPERIAFGSHPTGVRHTIVRPRRDIPP